MPGFLGGRQASQWGRMVPQAAVVLAVLGVVLGVVHAPVAVGPHARSQVLALARVGLTCVTAGILLVGPGLAIRGCSTRARRLPLGFLPVPGIVVLSVVGGVVWASAGAVDPHTTSRVLLVVELVVLLVAFQVAPPPLEPDEPRVLGVAVIAFVIALGRSMWSLGPAGELYGGTISRTLEVGDRPDSRISYHVVTMVAHGYAPYSAPAAALLAPYSFSDRGPLSGMLTAPIVLLTGATPATGVPSQPWSLFDPQGFMAYRIVMMGLAVTALLAVHTLTRAAAGPAVAWLAVLTVAGTPFFIHDVYFTWPKFVAVAQCLLAAYLVLHRRWVLAGLFAGLGCLMHPVALLSMPALALFCVLRAVDVEATAPGVRARVRVVRASTAVVGLGAGLVVVLGAWRLVNGSHYSQGKFLVYLREGFGRAPVPFGTWVASRWTGLLNTFVPFRLPLREAHNPSINSVTAPSGTIVHVFFQYWTGLPFGASIVFYPLLLLGLGQMLLRRPVVTVAFGLVPLLAFVVYWGSYTSGLLREGLHPWVLTILILWAMQFAPRFELGAALPTVVRAVLVLRTVDLLVMMTVPSVDAAHALVARQFRVGDVAALALMGGGVVALAVVTWRGTRAAVVDASAADVAPVDGVRVDGVRAAAGDGRAARRLA